MNAASLSLGYTTAVTGVTAVAPNFWIGSSEHLNSTLFTRA